MKKMVKMTVIIPSYNNAEYMPEALDSIIMQKRDFPLEIIITDDCSTDDSKNVIEEYTRRYPDTIHAIFSEKNCGLYANYMKAVEIMDSEYFCVLDPDDYWTDEYRLQDAVNFLDSNDEYTIYASNVMKKYSDGSEEIYLDSERTGITTTYTDFISGNPYYGHTVASTYRNVVYTSKLKKKLTDLIGCGESEYFRGDTGRNIIHYYLGKCYYENKVVGVYRINNQGIWTRTNDFEKNILVSAAFAEFYQFFGTQNYELYYDKIHRFYKQAMKNVYEKSICGDVINVSENVNYCFAARWLKNQKTRKKRIKFSIEKFSDINTRTLVVWGTGEGARRILQKYNVKLKNNDFFVDSNPEKEGSQFLGRTVKLPKEICTIQNKYVLIASSYYNEIISEILKKKMCSEDELINIFDYIENFQ